MPVLYKRWRGPVFAVGPPKAPQGAPSFSLYGGPPKRFPVGAPFFLPLSSAAITPTQRHPLYTCTNHQKPSSGAPLGAPLELLLGAPLEAALGAPLGAPKGSLSVCYREERRLLCVAVNRADEREIKIKIEKEQGEEKTKNYVGALSAFNSAEEVKGPLSKQRGAPQCIRGAPNNNIYLGRASTTGCIATATYDSSCTCLLLSFSFDGGDTPQPAAAEAEATAAAAAGTTISAAEAAARSLQRAAAACEAASSKVGAPGGPWGPPLLAALVAEAFAGVRTPEGGGPRMQHVVYLQLPSLSLGALSEVLYFCADAIKVKDKFFWEEAGRVALQQLQHPQQQQNNQQQHNQQHQPQNHQHQQQNQQQQQQQHQQEEGAQQPLKDIVASSARRGPPSSWGPPS